LNFVSGAFGLENLLTLLLDRIIYPIELQERHRADGRFVGIVIESWNGNVLLSLPVLRGLVLHHGNIGHEASHVIAVVAVQESRPIDAPCFVLLQKCTRSLAGRPCRELIEACISQYELDKGRPMLVHQSKERSLLRQDAPRIQLPAYGGPRSLGGFGTCFEWGRCRGGRRPPSARLEDILQYHVKTDVRHSQHFSRPPDVA